MNFGLLLSQLPRIDQSRAHYDTLLDMQEREARFIVCWRFLRNALLR